MKALNVPDEKCAKRLGLGEFSCPNLGISALQHGAFGAKVVRATIFCDERHT
jgi:hypothetical protein